MEKTKLGVSVGLLGAAIFFTALFGGYVALFILGGYILLCEENEWLKKSVVKAVALLMVFSVLSYAIDLIPDLFRWLDTFLSLLTINISFSFIYNIVSLLTQAIAIVKIIAFLVLGMKAMKKESFAISAIDDLVNKNM